MNKILPCLACLLLAACGEKSPTAPVAATPKLVKTLTVDAGASASEFRYSGEVRARVETTLGFRVGGKLTERLVDAGARVKAGQVLARLDPADQQLAVTQAEANRTLATAELKRTQELRQKNFISQAALDAKESTATAAEAQARLAKNQTAYTTLAADAAGIVVAVLAEPGQVVSAGQGVFRLARDGEREIAIAVPETRIAGLKVGAGGTASLWAGGGQREYSVVVREIAPMADPLTRTFPVRLRIVDANVEAMLGMSAEVRFAADGPPTIQVPLAAILQQGDRPAVWVVSPDQTVSQRPIDIERYSDAGAVVKSGLQAGETIVAAGAFKLAPGEKVRVVTAP